MTSPGPPAAWYADPGGSGGLRYWDGHGWTEHVTAPAGPGGVAGVAGVAGGYGSILPAAGGPAGAFGAPSPTGRKVWPLFVVIGVLFVVAVVVGIAKAVPKVLDAGGRVTDEAAQSTAHLAADAGAELYALEGSYLGASPERLEQFESGLTFTTGPSTEFTTASVDAGEDRFVVAVNSLTNRCFVVVLEDEVGGMRTTGQLPEGVPCWASIVGQQTLEPVDDF